MKEKHVNFKKKLLIKNVDKREKHIYDNANEFTHNHHLNWIIDILPFILRLLPQTQKYPTSHCRSDIELIINLIG